MVVLIGHTGRDRARDPPTMARTSPTLRNRLGRLRPTRLELVSVHLPKTAGSTFRGVLERAYGDDLAPVYGGVRLDGRAVRAVHGHFPPAQFWSAARRAKLIMWVREPAERLASYYDFWRRVPYGAGNELHDEFLRREMTFDDFVQWAPIRSEFENLYLQGVDGPDDFDFIGFTERFDDDLGRLARLMGWTVDAAPAVVNRTDGERTSVNPRQRALVERHHGAEVDFHRRARERFT
jgi:hypothetical protein